MSDLSAVLASRVLVLDGGLGTLLEARGNDLTSALWSAALLRDRPDEVRAAHAEFAAAGADVLTTSTYQLTFGGEIDDSDVERLLRRHAAPAAAPATGGDDPTRRGTRSAPQGLRPSRPAARRCGRRARHEHRRGRATGRNAGTGRRQGARLRTPK